MKALVTGGAGFIGSHLCDALIDRGDEVAVLDDLSTGRFENISHLEGNPNFSCVIDSILKEEVVDDLVKQCDRVFHLAAAVGNFLIVKESVRSLETNIHGTELVLKSANRYRKKTLITSSSEVYGKKCRRPLRETDDLDMGPTTIQKWAYAGSKIIDEFLALAYWKEKQLPVVVVRLFNTVGPRQIGEYGMVLPNFARQALAGEPITVFGDGAQTRCFTHVADVVPALIALMESDETNGEIFNLGSDHEISMLDLAERVKKLSGSRSPIKKISYETAYGPGYEDLMRRVPDIRKVERAIGYAPKHDLDSTIRSIVDCCKNSPPSSESPGGKSR